MKIATWNVNSLAVRLPQVLDWLGVHQPDVLCLQETKLPDDKFTHAEFKAAGYEAQWFGQKTYNGVALLSKTPATDVVRNIFGFDDEQTRVIAGSVEGVYATRRHGPGRSIARPKSASISSNCSHSACTTPFASSSRSPSCTAGGTTACGPSTATRACASTTSS